MSHRRRNAVKCRTCHNHRTHHRTGHCSRCREVPPVQKHTDGGVVLLGQIRLTETQALQLVEAIADALETTAETGEPTT